MGATTAFMEDFGMDINIIFIIQFIFFYFQLFATVRCRFDFDGPGLLTTVLKSKF